MSTSTETCDCVNFVVKHTFVELQGVEGEQTAKLLRRRSDIGPLRTAPTLALEYAPGQETLSACHDDDDDDDEDIKASTSRRVSFVSSVDSDDFIGSPPLNMSTEWSSTTCRYVDTKAELAWAPCSSSDSTVSSCSQSPWAPCSSSDSTFSMGSQLAWAPCSSNGSSYSSDGPPLLYRLLTSSQQACQEHLTGIGSAQEVRKRDIGRELDFAPDDSGDAENRTTVMVRNMSNSLCQLDFVNQLKQRGFNGLFDFVYMPMNLREHGSFGYAFVNFTSSSAAVQFRRQLEALEHDDDEWRFVWSTCQGMSANVERYQNSPLMHNSVPADCKPALYDQRGIRVKFPAPTKAIPKPRIHLSKSKAVEKDSQSSKMVAGGLTGSHNGKHDVKSQSRLGKKTDGDRVWPSMSRMSANVASHMMSQFSRIAHPR